MCDFGFFPNETAENHPPTKRKLTSFEKNCHILRRTLSYNLCLSKFCDHCDGNKIEDTEYYLLKCSGYTTPRITLLLNVKHICPGINITLLRDLVKIIIEGSNDLSTVMNQELFTHVYKSIKSTHRFIR
jgi:hypothetical protein